MTINLEKALQVVKDTCKLDTCKVVFNQIELEIDKDSLLDTLSALKDGEDCQFRQLTDIAGVDYPNRYPRFEVVYHLLDFKQNVRLRIKTKISEDDAVPSITSLYPCANWYEREAFDMY